MSCVVSDNLLSSAPPPLWWEHTRKHKHRWLYIVPPPTRGGRWLHHAIFTICQAGCFKKERNRCGLFNLHLFYHSDCPLFVQAVLRGDFCYKEYGLLQPYVHGHSVSKVMLSLQQVALPLLERLNQLLEDKLPASSSPSPCNQTTSGPEPSQRSYRFLHSAAL